jgi:hypothetical protein
MKRIVIAILSSVVLLTAVPLLASVCGMAQPPGVESGPYIVDHYIADTILHRRWAVVVDCAHPDRPWTLKAALWQSESRVDAAAAMKGGHPVAIAQPLIPAGAKVRMWRTADGADIELTGTALDAGVAGQTIHVRTGSRGTVLEGRVRGVGSVELLHADRWTMQ